ncbi:hypothetical protein [Streptomyces scopuliridis]|uniref:hypothetical protein n=1 Tax=Streptomyces scopuliridis TaxID=452529 RepID=UPI003682650D
MLPHFTAALAVLGMLSLLTIAPGPARTSLWQNRRAACASANTGTRTTAGSP